MIEQPITIPKQLELKPAEDFYGLRREGIGLIEQMGSQLWTDYNTHDPGVTILEALCYALTDLAYRTGWDIQDLLAYTTLSEDPYPNQPFPKAREILTVNPWTPDDFRRLLIDLNMVRNAWVFCRENACDVSYNTWCEKDELILSYQTPTNPQLSHKKVEPRGLYDVRLELESDPALGDLNDRKIEHTFQIEVDGAVHEITMELRFPEWGLENRAAWKLFLQNDDAFTGQNSASFTIDVSSFGATKTYDVQTDPERDTDDKRDAYLRNHWRTIFYVSFGITYQPSGESVTIEHAALRLFGNTSARNEVTVASLVEILEDLTPAGFIQRYRNKLLKVEEAVTEAKKLLHMQRNLDEDYCRISGVNIEDVAVCADVEVTPDADIEKVQAEIWFEIERYFNPPVPFYTLKELLDSDIPVEDIFNGPKLKNGFIKSSELEAAQLKTELRTSDIINLLMDIEGVVAVNNLLLTKYDTEGNVIPGAADPTWTNGTPIFDPNKISASWLLFVSNLHQPRLYHNQSRFLFYKNGLSFLPRQDEAYDTLTQLRGETERPKIQNAPLDLTTPVGTSRDLSTYAPVQYSFPLTYGIGPDGLPSHASVLRRAQAKQLKAYLLVFEQILGNAFAQIANTAKLFSLDPAVDRTYFVRELSESLIQGYDEITNSLSKSEIEALTETEPEFLERRNRFLDHILARFGEQFGDYALLLTNQHGQQVARDRLIEDKLSFLKAYPQISHDRGKAFNIRTKICAIDNVSGLKKRISLLLGYPDLTFSWQNLTNVVANQYEVNFELHDQHEKVWLEGNLTVVSDTEGNATTQAFRDIITQMVQTDAYDVIPESAPFQLQLKDKQGNQLAQVPQTFATKEEAIQQRDELLSWSSNERAIIVEHLLLRPKFPGDALYPACADDPCHPCGEEDPYSFRLTFVMPGWSAPFNENLEMRGFADRTIRQETPAHLLSKICWVGNNGFIEDPCDPVIDELTQKLLTQGLTSDNTRPSFTEACDCAATIFAAFSTVFQDWYEDKTLDNFQPDVLKTELETEFSTQIDPTNITCTTILDATLWSGLEQIMVQYFQSIALEGWQFERFEDAWCKWLEANAEFDWTEERLQERVEAILTSNVETGPTTEQKSALSTCATTILTTYGTDFYNWMANNIKEGHSLTNLTDFTPSSINLCSDFTFKPGTVDDVTDLLENHYGRYKAVSYRLWILVHQLSELRSIYPPATLHDCDDGSDENPVRLGQTLLGNG